MKNKIMKSGLMLGVNPFAERQVDDFYATNPKALELFYKKFNEDGNKISVKVWEPSCGMGHLSKVLEGYGHDVLSTDLVNRGYGEGAINFLDDVKFHAKDFWEGDILTNPPFKLAEEFVEKGMARLFEGRYLYLFLKIQFLEGQKRKELFKKYPPKFIYCHSSRQLCCKDAEFEKYTATTQFYAWYVWEKGFTGDTIIRWI